jgi:hypothetical protein
MSPRDYSTPGLAVRAAYAFKAALRNPILVGELGRKFVQRVWTADAHARRLDEYARFAVSEATAIQVATGASPQRVAEVLAESALETIRAECLALAARKQIGGFTWGGFAEVCYAICRLNRPTTVVETGVAFGWTSAFMLAALQENGHGHLFSVDLPAFRPGAASIAGAVVPERLRARWTLRLGSQQQVLPAVLEQAGRVDFFHYDSDKTYHGMKWGYAAVWPRLSPGGVLMSDDVDNDAFLEFAGERQLTPVVLVKPVDGQRVALIRRA